MGYKSFDNDNGDTEMATTARKKIMENLRLNALMSLECLIASVRRLDSSFEHTIESHYFQGFSQAK
jgi:hypothetical protein